MGLLTIITFSSSQVASVLTYPAMLFTDLQLVIALVIGLPLAFWAIRRVIGLVRAR